MNNRERTHAILHYQDYDRLPLVHFGFWDETLLKWAAEGHLTAEEAHNWYDGYPADVSVSKKLGLDFSWGVYYKPVTDLYPPIEEEVLEEYENGSRKIVNDAGAIVIDKPGTTTIPTEVDHLLKGRAEWEKHFLPRLQFRRERIEHRIRGRGLFLDWDAGGREYLEQGEWQDPYGIRCGSLFGVMRNWLGVVGSAYLQVDDPVLFDEIIDTGAELALQCTKAALEVSSQFDFAFYWEDICYRSGPLINPKVFATKVGPHYRRINDLLLEHGIDIVSLDCDGCIDALVPIWLENGVNTMFPIEVGVWGGSIEPWRKKYGMELRGVGGMDKRIFARDYAAIDAEIERLKPLVDLGGYIPCPDHRIPADAKWENVQYYAERMRKAFG